MDTERKPTGQPKHNLSLTDFRVGPDGRDRKASPIPSSRTSEGREYDMYLTVYPTAHGLPIRIHLGTGTFSGGGQAVEAIYEAADDLEETFRNPDRLHVQRISEQQVDPQTPRGLFLPRRSARPTRARYRVVKVKVDGNRPVFEQILEGEYSNSEEARFEGRQQMARRASQQ